MQNLIDQLDESQLVEVHWLMKGEWWCSDRTLAEVRAVVDGSTLSLAYVEPDGSISAFVRVLTDGIFKAMLFDMIVRPDYRYKGLGRKLVQQTVNHPMLASAKSIELYCPDSISGFYTGMGFNVSDSKLHRLRRA